MPDGPLDAFLASRESLICGASGGTADTRMLADLTDGAVLGLTEPASSACGAPFALFALGGYGARRLLPHSDIDLLVISRGTKADLDPLVRALLYPLWDAGLTVGHQVRAPKDHVRALGEDVEILTSFLTARFLAGDESLAAAVLADGFRRIRKDTGRALALIAGRERPGSPYLLESDLKEGAGGQRDLDELVWRAAIVSNAPAHDAWPLASSGVLTFEQIAAVFAAQDALSAARWRLHAASGRARNLMTVEDAEAARIDAEGVQRALETVHHTLLLVRRRAAGAPASDAGPLTGRTLASIAARPDALDALESAAWQGRLESAAPGFRDLMTLRRPALSHRYTVGDHCLRTAAIVGAPDGIASSLEPEVRDALLAAALTHDVGKRRPGPGHAARGANEAAATAERLGFGPASAEMAARLVAEHLLLAETATRADPADEDVVLATAARIGDPRLVGALVALTAADMRATGPDVWTAWRAALVTELAARLEAALSPDVDGAGIAAAAEATRAAALKDASSVGASAALLRFLADAPLRYLARRTPADVVRDARLAMELRGPSRAREFTLGARPGPVPETWAIDILAPDRPGLMATVAGVLALSGLDVLAADAFTDHSGIAIDTFTVASATLAPIEHATWASVERALDAALHGALDLETRLVERRRHYRPSGPSSAVRVRVDTPSAFGTAVHVRAPDRVGLLHDLALAIADAGLDIRRAVVTTAGSVADDTFEVIDADGEPPQARALEAALVPLLGAAAEG